MKWLEPWVAIVDLDWPPDKKANFCQAWESQLRREVGPLHVPFDKPATLIARRFDTDDALFQVSEQRVAEVHLTWSRGPESDPTWPNASVYETLEDWARERMSEQHRQWAAEQ